MAQATIGDIKYTEALQLPILERSLERLVNKYAAVMAEYHLTSLNETIDLIEKALAEGNGILIQHDYIGYFVNVWHERAGGTT